MLKKRRAKSLRCSEEEGWTMRMFPSATCAASAAFRIAAASPTRTGWARPSSARIRAALIARGSVASGRTTVFFLFEACSFTLRRSSDCAISFPVGTFDPVDVKLHRNDPPAEVLKVLLARFARKIVEIGLEVDVVLHDRLQDVGMGFRQLNVR